MPQAHNYTSLQQNTHTRLSLSDARLHPRVHLPHTQASVAMCRLARMHGCASLLMPLLPERPRP